MAPETLSIPLTGSPLSFAKPRGRACLLRSTVPAYVAMKSATGTHSIRLQPNRAELLRLQGYAPTLAAASIEGNGHLEVVPVL
jgi:hypothetical protein